MSAVELANWSCGLFFLTGLLTGAWKYACIARSPEARAPVYVDIAHRAGLMYAFASLVLAHFAALSRWPEPWNLLGVGVAVFFFATAEATYIVHGALADTDNQLKPPTSVGEVPLPGALVRGYMLALIAGEVGGFLVVFTGAMF